MSNIKGYELILILLVILLLFGAKRLPDAARGLGRSMRILKAETKGLRDDDGPAETGYSDTQGPRVEQRPIATADAPRREPVVDEPVVTQPVVTQPVVTQPVVTQPVVTQPVVNQPVRTPNDQRDTTGH